MPSALVRAQGRGEVDVNPRSGVAWYIVERPMDRGANGGEGGQVPHGWGTRRRKKKIVIFYPDRRKTPSFRSGDIRRVL